MPATLWRITRPTSQLARIATRMITIAAITGFRCQSSRSSFRSAKTTSLHGSDGHASKVGLWTPRLTPMAIASAPLPARRRRLRRTWPQRLLIGFSIVLALLCGAAAMAVWYAYDRVGDLQRVTITPRPRP